MRNEKVNTTKQNIEDRVSNVEGETLNDIALRFGRGLFYWLAVTGNKELRTKN